MLAFVGIGGIFGAVAAPLLRRRLSPRLVVVGLNWVYAAVIVALVAAPDAIVMGIPRRITQDRVFA